MSQVKFTAKYSNKSVEVVAGWDRPLSHYFLTIYDMDPESRYDTITSTMETTETGGCPEPSNILEILTVFGVQAPDGFLDRVARREGNVIHTHENGVWERMDL